LIHIGEELMANYGNVYHRTYIKNKIATSTVAAEPIILTLPLPETHCDMNKRTKSKLKITANFLKINQFT
jgi:hypothetical protein